MERILIDAADDDDWENIETQLDAEGIDKLSRRMLVTSVMS